MQASVGRIKSDNALFLLNFHGPVLCVTRLTGFGGLAELAQADPVRLLDMAAHQRLGLPGVMGADRGQHRVMFGNRLDLLVVSFLAASVAIFVCRKIRRRSQVITAGFLSGICIATFTWLFNSADQLPADTIFYQCAAGLVTGIVEGVVIAGLLPILEGLFKRTTDITLLELSDYNHPVLRRMQLEAPGTCTTASW